MKILISGGNSRFASELKKCVTDNILITVSKQEMDITNIESIETVIKKYRPDVFIHSAALSRPMSIHNENPDTSIKVNIVGTSNCILCCMQNNVKFVYISTDYVYPGIIGDYKETDGLYPVNKYAWSKLGGECACMLYDNSLILRMAMFEKPFPHQKAFTDSYKSCIWNTDAAAITLKLIDANALGIYNIGKDKKAIYDFVIQENCHIFKESRNNVKENVPRDSSMNLEKLKKTLNDSII
jgi:nucleoside-diphosphate-sugar epimerase